MTTSVDSPRVEVSPHNNGPSDPDIRAGAGTAERGEQRPPLPNEFDTLPSVTAAAIPVTGAELTEPEHSLAASGIAVEAVADLPPDDETDEKTWERSEDPQLLTIVLKSTGDRKRDTLRMRRVHGLLSSYPGSDHFAFHVYEASRSYRLEFPSSTTGYCRELRQQLVELLGEGTVQIGSLRIQ